jgi:multiple sugar transport system substrate-binding protein
MSDEQKKLVTRREMLRLTGATGLGLLATACGAQPETVTVVETVVVEKEVEKEVKVIETVEVEKEVIKEVEKVVTVEVEKEAAVTVEGALWVLEQKDFHPDYNEYIRSEINKYADEQGWPLDLSYIAGFAAGTGEVEKIAAAVQAGDPPDIVLHTFAVAQLRNLYVLQPVTEVVEAVEEVYGPASPYLRQTMYLDDQWWAVPYHQRAGGGYYRTDKWEDEAGIDVGAIRQYQDLVDAAIEVTDPDNGFYSFGITVNRSGDGNSMINRVKTGYGAGYQDETGQFIRTNSPEMITAMEFLKTLYTDEKYAPILPPGVLAWNDLSNNEAYLGGVIGYTQNAGTVLAKAFVDKNPVAEVTGYHKQCGGPVNQEFEAIGGKNWYILRGAKNTEAAKQLVLEFTANLERQNAMLASSPAYAIPAYTNLWEMSEFASTFRATAQQKSAALDDSGINPRNWPGPETAAIVAIEEAGIFNDMMNAILTGTEVATAVADAHDRMVLIFKEFDLPGEEA